ncbi:MAG TPA: hypothetical protein VMB19_11995, partial [Silvibacterium sp.]|nr:hypothetical protein [Silvibacterium sp.]
MHPARAVVLLLLLLASFPLSHSQSTSNTKPWTVKEIFGGPSLTGDPPYEINWSPDGSRATWIADNGDLMQVSAADGKVSELLDHSKIGTLLGANISEKDRDHRARY